MDADDVCHEHSIRALQLVSEHGGWDFILQENPKNNPYFLVYTLYDTGDSFHREANCICLVGLYKYYEDALVVSKVINADYKNTYEESNHRIQPSRLKLPQSGEVVTICTSTWKGHFERLVSVEIETLSCDKD